MVSIRNGTIIVLIALFLFPSVSYGDSRFQKDAIGSDGNISIFEHSDINLSSGVSLDGPNITPTQDFMTTSPPQIAWQKCLGGSSPDVANDVEKTADRGYIVAGETYSNDGNVSGNHGGEDFWVVKLDSIGNIEWQKAQGGSSFDGGYSVRPTADGGYIVAGITNSNDGNVSGNHGNGDVWVVKLNSPPCTPHKPSGPKCGYVKKTYVYATSATDPDRDKIKYTFDWGDGTTSVTGFVDSGERAAASHRWMEPGEYRVKVKATDSLGASSGWSKSVTVTETIAVAYVSG